VLSSIAITRSVDSHRQRSLPVNRSTAISLPLLVALVVLGSMEVCGGEIVVTSFELTSCPANDFTLPDTVFSDATSELRHVHKPGAYCPQHRRYAGVVDEGFDAAIRRGAPCRLDIVYRIVGHGKSSAENLRRIEAYMRPRVDEFASGVARSSGVVLRRASQSVEQFTSAPDFEAWCAATYTAAREDAMIRTASSSAASVSPAPRARMAAASTSPR
jgi:hypothetical protein